MIPAAVRELTEAEALEGLARDMIVEILPDEVRAPAANRVAPAIREMTHAEMHVLFDNHHPSSNVDQLIRGINGSWWGPSGAEAERWTDNRNEAHVFHGHGLTPAIAPLAQS